MILTTYDLKDALDMRDFFSGDAVFRIAGQRRPQELPPAHEFEV